jgi:hypothetical protein
VGLPEAPISGFTMHNVKISADQGLIVRYANVQGTNVVIESHDGTPIKMETKAVVSLK